jgi:hypothetical protein
MRALVTGGPISSTGVVGAQNKGSDWRERRGSNPRCKLFGCRNRPKIAKVATAPTLGSAKSPTGAQPTGGSFVAAAKRYAAISISLSPIVSITLPMAPFTWAGLVGTTCSQGQWMRPTVKSRIMIVGPKR